MVNHRHVHPSWRKDFEPFRNSVAVGLIGNVGNVGNQNNDEFGRCENQARQFSISFKYGGDLQQAAKLVKGYAYIIGTSLDMPQALIFDMNSKLK